MLARISNPSNKENSVFLPNVKTCCSEYAGKGMKGGLGGNAAWTSVDCSVIGTSDFREGSCNCVELIDCLLVFNSIRLFSRPEVSTMGFAGTSTERVAGKLGRGIVGASGKDVAGTLNCGDPLTGDE